MEESARAEIQEEANALIINVNDNSGSQREANSPSGNEILNGDVDREANASIEDEHQDKSLANDITRMIESRELLVSRVCRIYRIPHVIRRVNEEAYTPQVISIGPFHHGDERLEPMEELKVIYFKKFVEKAVPNVEKLVSTIRGMEGDVRRCYAEACKLSSDNYVKMILLDFSFIIVFFMNSLRGDEWSMESDEYFVASQRSIVVACRDLWLLENQLPFFVIEELYNLAFPPPSNYPSVKKLTLMFIKLSYFHEMPYDSNLQIMHFVDLLRTILLPKKLPKRGSSELVVENLYSASQLYEAGVKFKVSSSKCLFDLKFKKGVLEIPFIQLLRDGGSLLRNIMALEQCFYLDNACFTHYVRILDFLIDTSKDLDILFRNGILKRYGDSQRMTSVVNNLCKNYLLGNMNSDYYTLCQDLNNFYELRWNRWKVILIREYFGNPWRTTATIAAIILLVLTLIQTVRSFY